MSQKTIDGGFVQLYRDYMPMLRRLMLINPMSANIFLYLAEKMEEGTNAIACSHKVFEEAFGVSRQTISTAVKELRELEFLTIYKMGTTNVYTMNAAVVWSDDTSGRAFATFNAKIIITASEQDKDIIKKIQLRKAADSTLPPDDAWPPDDSIAAAVEHAESTFTTQKPPRPAVLSAPAAGEPKDFIQESLPLPEGVAPVCKCGVTMIEKEWKPGKTPSSNDGKHYWECPARRQNKNVHDFKWGDFPPAATSEVRR